MSQTNTNEYSMKTPPTKPQSKTRPSLLLLVLGLALLGPAGAARADDLLVNTFDFDISGIAWQNWRTYVLGHDLTWDASQDADGNASSGSMYVTIDWPLASDPNWNNGWNDVQVAFAAGSFDPAEYLEVEAYIKIDETNSSTAMNGTSYGISGLYLSGGDGGWRQVQGYRVLNVTNGWQRISGSLATISPGTTSSQVVVGLISQAGHSLTNTVRYWLDNVKLIGPPSVHTNRPALSIAKAPPAGLTCMATAPDNAWQRQMVRTVNSSYSWHTATAASNTTTYAITVADFPGAAQSGFEAIMHLIPVAGMSNPDGGSVDWDAAHVIYFTITANADGTGRGNFRYKVNSAGAENFQSWTNHDCATGPLGTWQLAFNHDTNVTMMAPDGTSASFIIPDTDAANFQGDLIAYLGVRPAAASRIGESATFSRIKITGTPATIDDTFVSSGPPYDLDPATWVRKASGPQGIFITAPDAKYWLTWPQPDGGFTNLYVTDNLNKKLGNGEWSSLPVDATGWLNVAGARRLTVVNQSALNAAFSYAPTNCYFGLFHP
jgi:hypothetical protein